MDISVTGQSALVGLIAGAAVFLIFYALATTYLERRARKRDLEDSKDAVTGGLYLGINRDVDEEIQNDVRASIEAQLAEAIGVPPEPTVAGSESAHGWPTSYLPPKPPKGQIGIVETRQN